jgi:hypothetical protein
LKHDGSTFEYEQERNQDLMRAYYEDIAACEVIRLTEVWQRVANMSSARFWVSEERAAIVVARMMKGDKLKEMRPMKREMFQEIYNRVMEMHKLHPKLSIFRLCIFVVNSPAPKFYMTSLSVRQTVYKIKRQWNKHRMQK